MSYHAIENLVEDAVGLIAQTDTTPETQRKTIYNLYQFQRRFDCSYTVLRCFPFLERIGFIKKLPITQHPDYETHRDYFKNLQESGWLYADAGQGDNGEVVYYENGFIFPEYGSQYWRRVEKAGENTDEAALHIPVLTLIGDMIALAAKQGDETLMRNFYLAFLNAFLEFDIDTADGLPERFENWVGNQDLLRLRSLFTEHDLLKIKKSETDFEVPGLTYTLSMEADPDRQAKIRFLMDARKTVDQINRAYQKAKKALEQVPITVNAMGELARNTMENKGWIFVSGMEVSPLKTYKWIWYKNAETGGYAGRIFTEIIVEIELSSVLAKQHVQHGLLLEWQGKHLSADIADAHVEINPFEFIEDEQVKNQLNFLGLWVLPIKSKQAAILKSLSDFLHHLSPLDATYLHEIDAEFPERFFSRPYQSYIDTFESSEPITDFLLFTNLYSIFLLFIHSLVQEDKLKEALEINALQESRLTDRFRENIVWYKEHYTPYIQSIKKGLKPPLPELFRKNRAFAR